MKKIWTKGIVAVLVLLLLFVTAVACDTSAGSDAESTSESGEAITTDGSTSAEETPTQSAEPESSEEADTGDGSSEESSDALDPPDESEPVDSDILEQPDESGSESESDSETDDVGGIESEPQDSESDGTDQPAEPAQKPEYVLRYYDYMFVLMELNDDGQPLRAYWDNAFMLSMGGRFLYVEWEYDENGVLLCQNVYNPYTKEKEGTIRYTANSDGKPLYGAAYDAGSNRFSGGEVFFTYDADGNMVTETYYSDGAISNQYVYNADGQIVSILAHDQSCYLEYDENGNLTKMTDNSGTVIASFTYGEDGWLSSYEMSEMLMENIQYDADGHILSASTLSDGVLVTISTTYNDDGLLEKDALSGTMGSMSFVVQEVHYSYDSDGNKVKEEYYSLNYSTMQPVLDSETVYTYNSAGKVTQETTTSADSNSVIAYTYDSFGNMLSMTETMESTGGNSVITHTEYTYDAKNYLTEVSVYDVSASGEKTLYDKTEYSYSFDSSNHLIEWTEICYFEGELSYSMIQTYTYLENGRIASYSCTNEDAETTSISTCVLEYDSQGRVVSETITEDGETFENTYTYDEYGRLTAEEYYVYNYDTETYEKVTLTYTHS